jgi:hypothetical protein
MTTKILPLFEQEKKREFATIDDFTLCEIEQKQNKINKMIEENNIFITNNLQTK